MTAENRFAAGLRRYVPLTLLALLLAVVAELIGTFEFGIGIGTLTLLPLIWGLLLGAAISIQRVKPFPPAVQQAASAALQVGVLLLATRLAFNVGDNIELILEVGPALVLQEIGNLGTILVGLPLAVALGMGRASVGATFSTCREGSFVMVGERFGADSRELRGVLSMYVFGTVFGALWLGLLASVMAGSGWFNPLALAMGSGVGSGSMMAAAANSVTAAFPEMTDQILGLAALSNLLSSALGLYVGVYIALPLADRFYRLLTRRQRVAVAPGAGQAGAPEASVAEYQEAEAESAGPPASRWALLAMTTVAMIASVWAFEGRITAEVLPGFAVLVAIVAIALVVRRFLPINSLVTAMTLAILLSIPWSPVSGAVLELTAPIDFLPLTTPVLVFAGLGLGKDVPVLRSIGWRIIPVGLAVLSGTFIASVLIAQGVLAAGGS
ncbi:DUF3100 domain-containing protein [Brevibacterium album]|uniref:DUF3100 domain-containing protein n=1 Tax=Brevibacterium album TaxID=417948 RepID=UPI0003F816E6|nr:DUF3100 domain-containing protein [Brevibacterium album]